jgi:predicted amidohydrolase YtcJ
VLIRNAEVGGRRCDVRIAHDTVVELDDGLESAAGAEVFDAAGGALLPGLHDHHLHLNAWAAALRSVRCGPPQVKGRDGLIRALRGAHPRDGWVRGVGYHESVAGALDRDVLDGIVPEFPVRVQQRSGALWSVNSAGAAALGLDAGRHAPGVERDAGGRATGRLFRLDGWLRERLPQTGRPDLSEVGCRLAACGVTGVTDATPGNGAAEFAAFGEALAKGELSQRLVVMGTSALPEPPAGSGLARGAVKIVLDEARLPEFDTLVARVKGAHDGGRAVAVHCVTRAELVLAVAAFRLAGCREGDRIEHASVAPPEVVEGVASLPLTVVTQPNFVAERGDAYLADVEPADRPWLYRCRGFAEAQVPLGGGTDAPFGDGDPWAAMRAAVERRSAGGQLLGPREALAPERALALFTSRPEAPGGPPRRVAVGVRADLCLLDAPWGQARRDLSAARVRATWCGGVRALA